MATDGLLKYLPPERTRALAVAGDLAAVVDALIGAVTLPSGNLQDDVAIALAERAG